METFIAVRVMSPSRLDKFRVCESSHKHRHKCESFWAVLKPYRKYLGFEETEIGLRRGKFCDSAQGHEVHELPLMDNFSLIAKSVVIIQRLTFIIREHAYVFVNCTVIQNSSDHNTTFDTEIKEWKNDSTSSIDVV
ncbi:hypothetical protein NPIL_619261 [Nephila pilipes]|uniref:Uncharacterized protein n=1 Tax=Nephila pilipes TaxID=299642 RepID=A0A8X6ML09_NEPPI|nr:hypothetical protein NPIL_619261 [Nephila pilipes]